MLRLVALLPVAVALLPLVAAQTTLVNVANVAPVVASVTLPGATVSPTAGTTTSVTTTIAVTDVNGHNDVSSVTIEVLKPDGTQHIAPAAATRTGGAALEATFSAAFTMAFHDAPALATDTYKVKVVATDAQGATGTNVASLAVFNFAELAAVGLGSSTIDLGTLEPGAASSATAVSVLNRGNVQVDVTLSGTALAHADEDASLPVGSVAYSTASDMSASAALTGSSVTVGAFDLASGSSSSRSLYWQVTAPSGSDQWVPSGDYTGTLTVGAVKG